MNETIKLHVDLNERSYPIYIGTQLLDKQIFLPYLSGQQVLIVTNETVAPLYLQELKNNLSDLQCDEVILLDGEEHKNLQTLNLIFDELINKKHRRNTTLIALGGGVVGDITGFAAACYQRGVTFIQIPTTLLSQVDASVGGKTAVNHPLAKNMIGAFHQPRAVIVDINTLQTLPDREFRSGLAEVIKAALLADEDFFCWLEANISKLLTKDAAALQYAIKQAISIKVKIVIADERESNVRALLNLGHTFAHGIEQRLGFGSWHHGEAVAVGLVLAASVSLKLGWIEKGVVERIKNILTSAKLPIRLPLSVSADQLIESMSSDKKKETPQLKLVLLKGIGHAVVCPQIDMSLIEAIVAENQ